MFVPNCPLLALHAVGTQLVYWLRLYSPTALAIKSPYTNFSAMAVL
jgi:hypothetical protein